MTQAFWTQTKINQLIDLRKTQKLRWEEIGKTLETTAEACRCKYKDYKRSHIFADKVEAEILENTAAYTINSDRIMSLEDAIKACNIDLDTWEIERHVINSWEMGRKDTHSRLEFVKGKIDGFSEDSGKVNIETLYQVKIWLVRKVPVRLAPVVLPVEISSNPLPYSTYSHVGPKRALILADAQIGFTKDVHRGTLTSFHDRTALLSVLNLAYVHHPDIIVHIGDMIDFSEWSDKYIRSPEFYWTTQPAIIEAAWWLNQFQHTLAKDGQSFFLEANHELRVRTHMINHLSAAYGLKPAYDLDAPDLLSLDGMLGLSKMGIKYVENYPNNVVWLNNNLKCIHGALARSQPQATARALVERSNDSIIFGHIHKREMASKSIFHDGYVRTVSAYCPGCLCDIEGKIAWASNEEQWQQGAFMVDLFDDDRFVVNPIIIEKGLAYFQGSVYDGRDDILAQIKSDTSWNF